VGKAAVHPKQVKIINRFFCPTEEEIAEANTIVAAYEASPGGAIRVGDKMVDRPTTGQEIRFDEWRSYIRTDFIVVGKLLPQGADRYAAQFELYNVLNGQKLAGTEPGKELTATAPSL